MTHEGSPRERRKKLRQYSEYLYIRMKLGENLKSKYTSHVKTPEDLNALMRFKATRQLRKGHIYR